MKCLSLDWIGWQVTTGSETIIEVGIAEDFE